jgi:hypothetical protein
MHDSSKQTRFISISTSIHAWHCTFEVNTDSRRDEDAGEPNSAADQGAEEPLVKFHRESEKFSSPSLELWDLLRALNLDVKDILERVDYPIEGQEDDDATEEPRK